MTQRTVRGEVDLVRHFLCSRSLRPRGRRATPRSRRASTRPPRRGVGVLTQLQQARPGSPAIPAPGRRAAAPGCAAPGRSVVHELDDQAAGLDVRIVEQRLDGADRPERRTGVGERRFPVVGAAAREHLRQLRRDRLLAFGRGRQLVGEVGTFDGLTERGPGAGLGRRDRDQLAVGGAVGAAVRGLAPAGRLPRRHTRDRLPEHPGGAVGDGGVDVAPPPVRSRSMIADRIPTTEISAPNGTASTKSGVGGTVSPAMSPSRPE